MSILDTIRSWFPGASPRLMSPPDTEPEHADRHHDDPRAAEAGEPPRTLDEEVRPPAERYND